MDLIFLTFKNYLEKEKKILFFACLNIALNFYLLHILNNVLSSLKDDHQDKLLNLNLNFLHFLFVLGISCYASFRYYSLNVTFLEKGQFQESLSFINSIYKIKVDFFLKQNFYQLLSTLIKDLNLVKIFNYTLLESFVSLLWFVIIFTYSFFFHKCLFFLLLISLGVLFFLKFYAAKASLLVKNIRAKDQESVNVLGEQLAGIKELKIYSTKKEKFKEYFLKILLDSRMSREKYFKTRNLTSTVSAFLNNLSLVMFVIISWYFFSQRPEEILQSIVFYVFSYSYLMAIIQTIINAPEANQAFKNFNKLKKEILSVENHEKFAPSPDDLYQNFRSIKLRNVSFCYGPKEDKYSFTLGPIDLDILRGKLIFIIGGNGSGKTTLLHIISGLFIQNQGEIIVDGQQVKTQYLDKYRRLFSVIFADHHLFDHVYIPPKISLKNISRLLRLLHLEKKTKYQDGQFTNQNLSTGQKKRLALVHSLMENTPCLIFDEWTAEQDPVYRKTFYNEILPDLKKQGKTIIVVTHDNRYWSQADQVIKIDYGKLAQTYTP